MSGHVGIVHIPLFGKDGSIGAAATADVFGFEVPTASLGGGITVLGVEYCSPDAIAAASAPVFTTVKKTAAGVTNGTVATTTGSVAWGAGTSILGTISTAFLNAGEQLWVTKAQTAGNDDSPIVGCSVLYVMGR